MPAGAEGVPVVGLTGGIGSGKSQAAEYFQRDHGIEIVDADEVARAVVEPGTEALQQIRDRFGAEVLLADGALDRRQLRAKVFDDDEARRWLESLLHPLIALESARRLSAAAPPYVLLSAALLLETGARGRCERVVVVDVPERMQLQRAAERDGADPETIAAIARSQMARDERRRQADHVLDNSGTLEQLRSAVAQLHAELAIWASNLG